jgi:type II secretory pathway pseudopilin PulG
MRVRKSMLARPAFTLMEMMVVVAIIIVLGGIAIVAYTSLGDRGNEAKAAAAVKQIDEAVYYFYLEHKEYPGQDLTVLTMPDKFGKTYLKAEALSPPWPGSQYVIDYNAPYNKALAQEKPDIYIVHPNGKFMFGNWQSGKIATGK